MKFFRKKDKRKAASYGGEGRGGMPGVGAGFNGLQPSPPPPAGSGAFSPFGSATLRNGEPSHTQLNHFRPAATRRSAALLADLPAPVLGRIFAFVCPHSRDESYDTCEESAIEDTCMLCDLRDLAHCVAVCKRWRREAITQL